MSDLLDRTSGRWLELLPRLGVPNAFLTGKHMGCPICREGKDRFRWTDHNDTGAWICNQCGTGTGVDLVMKINGFDFKRAAQEIEKVLGMIRGAPPPKKAQRSPEEIKASMKSLWDASAPIAPGSPQKRYLEARGLGAAEIPPALRAVSQMRHSEAQAEFPGILAKVASREGRAVNVHRTYLSPEGTKAPVDSPRRMMPGTVPDGAAIRLARHGETLGVAEGIETALSASVLFDGMPVWSAIDADHLRKFLPPDGVTKLVIFGDNDASYTGHAAAYALAQVMRAKKIDVEVRIPEAAGDWNDVLTRGK